MARSVDDLAESSLTRASGRNYLHVGTYSFDLRLGPTYLVPVSLNVYGCVDREKQNAFVRPSVYSHRNSFIFKI